MYWTKDCNHKRPQKANIDEKSEEKEEEKGSEY